MIDEIIGDVRKAVDILKTSNAKRVTVGVAKAYLVGPMIRVDIDTRKLRVASGAGKLVA